MAIGPVIEVLIGLVFVFFVFSLVCSGINEYIARTLQKRTDFLVAGVWQLLHDADEPTRSYFQRFWQHPLVMQLAQSFEGTKEGWRQQLWQKVCARAFKRFTSRTAKAARLRRIEAEEVIPDKEARRLPSYIPTTTFVTVFNELVKEAPPRPGSELQRSYDALKAAASPEQVQQNIGRWFDDQMDRVSGWYKRESKALLFWIGVLVVLFMNVDTINVARNLWSDPTARRVLNDAAQAQLEAVRQASATTVAGSPATAPALQIVCDEGDGGTPTTSAGAAVTTTPASAAVKAALDCARALPLPIGWRLSEQCLARGRAAPAPCKGLMAKVAHIGVSAWRDFPGFVPDVFLKIVGLLMTAAAVSFGAPFWFDLLNRFGSLRGTGKPPPTGTSSS